MKLIRIFLIQQAIYLSQASAVDVRDHGIVQRDRSTRLLSTTTSSWSNILALICPPDLKYCPHHKDKQESSTREEGSDATDISTSSATSSFENTPTSSSISSSTTDGSTSYTSSSGSTSDMSTSSLLSSTTSSGGSESTTSSGGSESTSSTSSSSSSKTETDDTEVDESSTVYYKKQTTDDNVLEEENNATKDIVGEMNLGFLYIVGAVLLVGGLAMAVVQKRKRSTANIEGRRTTGLIDLTEDPESAFVAMEMAGIDNNNDNFVHTSIPSSDIYTDIDDIVVEYGVKM
jgi:hypothetical protein